MSCKIKLPSSCLPTHSSSYSTAPHPGLESTPDSGISSATATRRRRRPSRRFCAPWGWRRIRPRIWSGRWPRWRGTNGSGCCRPRWSCAETGSGGTAAACAGGTAGQSRALRGAARRRRDQRVRTQSVGTAAGGVGRNGRAHLGARAGHAAHAAAAGLSRGVGQRGREPGLHALHRDAGARVYGPAPGARRPRGGDRGQPVRRALGAQLGLRRFPRSARA